MPNPEPILTPLQAQADTAFALELIGQFFAQQIDAGAAQFEEVAALIRRAAENVADRTPGAPHHAEARAAQMMKRLPGSWAQGEVD